MPKNYTLDDILNEYSGTEKSAVKTKPLQPKTAVDNKKIQDTGFFKIPASGKLPENTIAYTPEEIEEINAEKKPSPSHKSGKFKVSDVGRPNVSYINSVKDVVKNPANLPPRPTDEIKDYDGAVVTKTTSDEDYVPRVRKMSDSTRAKEMRQKRKKKKQPEFTYDKESPDGIYTRPQKRRKKFIVSSDDGKKKKIDKMAPVDFSSDADPSTIDVDIDSAQEMRVVNTNSSSKSAKKESTIKDYDSFEDAREIRKSISELKSSFSFRFFILSFLFVFSLIMMIGQMNLFPVPDLLTPTNPRIFSGISLIVTLLSMLISLDTVKSGLLNLLKFHADTDSLAVFSSLASAAAAASCMAAPKLLEANEIYLYTSVSLLVMIFNAVGKKLILKRASLNFEFASKHGEKHAIICVEDDLRAESFTRGTIGDFPILGTMKRTNFLKDFSKYTFSTDSADKICRWLVPIIIIFSLLAAGFVTFMKVKTFNKEAVVFALSVFTLYISACSCMAMPLIANIPLGKAAKKYARNHGVMLGYQSIEDYYDVNSVMIDANKLFPAGSVGLCSIKLFSDRKIDDVILDAASLTSHADSILTELFNDIVEGKNQILKYVENFVYEDGMGLCGWIDNKRVLLGNRELMHSHNIEGVPTKTKENEFTEGGKDALYLSVSGNLSAMFIIEISASQNIKNAMKQLEKRDMAIIVKTIDPFITINRLSGLFDFTEELIKIIPTRMIKDYDDETKKVKKFSTSLACSGKFASFVQLLMSTKSIRKIVSSGIFMQSVSVLLGLIIVSMHCIFNAQTDLSPLWMIIYNLICTIVTAIVVGIRKI